MTDYYDPMQDRPGCGPDREPDGVASCKLQVFQAFTFRFGAERSCWMGEYGIVEVYGTIPALNRTRNPPREGREGFRSRSDRFRGAGDRSVLDDDPRYTGDRCEISLRP